MALNSAKKKTYFILLTSLGGAKGSFVEALIKSENNWTINFKPERATNSLLCGAPYKIQHRVSIHIIDAKTFFPL